MTKRKNSFARPSPSTHAVKVSNTLKDRPSESVSHSQQLVLPDASGVSDYATSSRFTASLKLASTATKTDCKKIVEKYKNGTHVTLEQFKPRYMHLREAATNLVKTKRNARTAIEELHSHIGVERGLSSKLVVEKQTGLRADRVAQRQCELAALTYLEHKLARQVAERHGATKAKDDMLASIDGNEEDETPMVSTLSVWCLANGLFHV